MNVNVYFTECLQRYVMNNFIDMLGTHIFLLYTAIKLFCVQDVLFCGILSYFTGYSILRAPYTQS
jgi:hypothetical protein